MSPETRYLISYQLWVLALKKAVEEVSYAVRNCDHDAWTKVPGPRILESLRNAHFELTKAIDLVEKRKAAALAELDCGLYERI